MSGPDDEEHLVPGRREAFSQHFFKNDEGAGRGGCSPSEVEAAFR